MQHTHSPTWLRRAFCDWIGNDGYTHALTLNTDRELALPQLTKIFGRFARHMDQAVFGLRNLRMVPTDVRFRAIAFPENLEINAHLHAAADLTLALDRLGDDRRVRKALHCCWLQATKSAGSVNVEDMRDKGWAEYSTKRGQDFIHSWDFHPR